MSLRTVREALATTIKIGKPEMNIYRTVPARPVYPAVVIIPSNDTTIMRETMGHGKVLYIDVHVFFAFADMESSQDSLDAELDDKNPTSVWTLLENDSTLGGTVMDSTPLIALEYGQAGAEEAGGASFIGAKIRVEVREC